MLDFQMQGQVSGQADNNHPTSILVGISGQSSVPRQSHFGFMKHPLIYYGM